jgi:hypothetical protein
VSGANDYTVLDGDRAIGRIFLSPQSGNDVRFTPKSGHVRRNSACPLCANSGHAAIQAPTARLYWQHDLLKARWMPQSPKSRHKPQAMTADGLMTAAQAATLKRLAQDVYELDAFKPNLTRTEADIRIAMLTAKLKLLDGPPHAL